MAKTPKPDDSVYLDIDGTDIRISSPTKPYFTKGVQLTKLDIAKYFEAVAPGALRGIRDRPIVLKRFVNGAEAEPFYQKRSPSDLPSWMRTVTLTFPSGRTAEEVVVDKAAGLLWVVNLGCMELHPHPVFSADLDHPAELRVDLDPTPGIEWPQIQQVAMLTRDILKHHGLVPFVKTSGSRGIHINCPIHPQWSFTEVRRAALALAREVERQAPALATSKWWKEERRGVFLDYNQNAKDRTTASAYSVRPLPDARVSAPLRWEEVLECNPADFTVLTMPARFAAVGDPHDGMESHAASLDPLLELAARDEASGLADAPWPPHFAKQEGEAPRVQPSKAKSFSAQSAEGFGKARFHKQAKKLEEGTELAAAEKTKRPRAARTPKFPLLTISQSPDKAAAEAGLERWKTAHAEAASHLAIDDVLVDRMRGASYIWYRIRVNLRNVPESMRPAQGTPDPDEDPTRAWREGAES